MEKRRYRIRVPTGICSKNTDVESPVTFKNLTKDSVSLYWINYDGKATFYADLGPVDRCNVGLRIQTYVSHPWVAIQRGKMQLLLNGKRYFFPPNPQTWKFQQRGWLQDRWNSLMNNDNQDAVDGNKSDQQSFEVLILSPACKSLMEICLLRCCELCPSDALVHTLPIPKNIMLSLVLTRKKYFV